MRAASAPVARQWRMHVAGQPESAAAGCAPRDAHTRLARARHTANARPPAEPGSAPDRARKRERGVLAQAQPARDVRRRDRILRRTQARAVVQRMRWLSAQPRHGSRPAGASRRWKIDEQRRPCSCGAGGGCQQRSRGPAAASAQPGWPQGLMGLLWAGADARPPRLRPHAPGSRGGRCDRTEVGGSLWPAVRSAQPDWAGGCAPRPPPPAAAPPRPGWRRRSRAGSPPWSPAAPWGLRAAQGVLSTGSLAPPEAC